MHPHRHPRVDADSLYVLQDAIETLAIVRGLDCPLGDPDQPYDPADVLHLLWSLVLQADEYLADVIADARAYGYSYDQIRAFLTPQPHPPSYPPAQQRHQTRRALSQEP
jgi:hypothetical protein